MAVQNKSPQEKRQAEKIEPFSQSRFYGQVSDSPPSTIDTSHEERLINAIDRGQWQEGTTGSRLLSSGAAVPSGYLNGACDAQRYPCVVAMFGGVLYTSPKDFSSWSVVANRSPAMSIDVDADFDMQEGIDGAVVVFAGTYLIKVVLSGVYPWCYQLNDALPPKMAISLINAFSNPVSAESAIRPWVYRYLCSGAIITGTGNRNRLTDGAVIEHETGTNISGFMNTSTNDMSDYITAAYTLALSEVIVPATPRGPIHSLVTPKDSYHLTHWPLYRTKNIGRNSTPAGIDPISGIGNNSELYAWVDDVPVAKPIVCTIATAGTITATIDTTKYMGWVAGDLYSYLIDKNQKQYQITGITSSAIATLTAVAGKTAIPDGVAYCGLADWVVSGSPSTCMFVTEGTQSGNLFTSNSVLSLPTDCVGKPVFWADGSTTWIKSRINSSQAVMWESATHADQACVLYAQSSPGLRRSWYDTVRDEGQDVGVDLQGLQERINATIGADLYQPKRFFEPMPGGDTGVVDTGFIVAATRDDGKAYYCQIGDKKYLAGHYRPDVQYEDIPLPIKAIKPFTSLAVIICARQTRNMNLTVATNVGNTDLGETVEVLQKSTITDAMLGVIYWQSIQFKGANLIIALLNDLSLRTYNGSNWSSQDLTLLPSSNLPCVKKYLRAIDAGQGVRSMYSREGGYKLFFYRWVA